MKSCTDIEQSKKLAKMLPAESADMYYWCANHYPKEDWIIEVGEPDNNYGDWSQYLAEQFYKLASLDAKDPLVDNHAGYLILKEISDMVDKTAEFYKNNPEALVEDSFLLGLFTALEEKGPEVAVNQLKSSKYKNT